MTKGYYGAVAEFESASTIFQAAKKATEKGYRAVDAHTPFPVHGMDDALKQGPSPIGWICTVCGLTGILAAQLMMWWMNGWDYPLWVSGKLPYAWPATIPITFECMVLLSAFGAVFGMFGLNRLPTLYRPVFKHSTFHRVTDDRFFLAIEATDPLFDQANTVAFLTEIGGKNVELVES